MDALRRLRIAKLTMQKLEELRIVYLRHQRAQWEYEARSRYNY